MGGEGGGFWWGSFFGSWVGGDRGVKFYVYVNWKVCMFYILVGVFDVGWRVSFVFIDMNFWRVIFFGGRWN